MSTKDKLEEKKFVVECIKLYENLPALWNTKSKEYSNRDKKNQQYNILLRKYRQRYPNADKGDLVKKFNSLRTNFRKELKKIRDSQIEEPTSWFFDHMKFLINIDSVPKYQYSTSDDAELNEPEEVELEASEPRSKKRKNIRSTDELIRLATRRLKVKPSTSHQIATVWGDKLLNMDQNQRLIAEKVVNEVMFNGQLGLLNFNTALSNISSPCNLDFSTSVFNKNKTINGSEPLAESPNINNYAVRFNGIVNEDHINYPSSSPESINDELTMEQGSKQKGRNYTASEFDPLNNVIKFEK